MGVEPLDDEHRAILDYMTTLIDLLAGAVTPNTYPLVIRNFTQISESMSTHFRHEESILASSRYPDLERHGFVHRALEETVVGMQRRFEQQPSDGSAKEIACYLRDWWISHINDVDAVYATYLNCPPTLRANG